MSDKKKIEKNLKDLKGECKGAVLVAVTKYSPLSDIELAYAAGQRDFGENRTSDLLEKAQALQAKNIEDIRWHFIGHLQTNKVRELYKIPYLYAVHSVDSLRLLEELYKREHEFKGKKLLLFLQVKTSAEAEKSGLESYEELCEAVSLMMTKKESKLQLHGLMTMGVIRTEAFERDATACFKRLREIKNNLVRDYQLNDLKLSMGMSQDYQLALEEGADYVRIGSLIFK